MTSLEGQVVLVTGVTSGVGRSIVKEFVRRGAHVVGMGRRAELGSSLAGEVTAGPGSFLYVEGDVRVVADCERFVRVASDAHGRVDVLINNAGTVGDRPITDSHEVEEEQWDAVMSTNLKGAFFCARYALPVMLANSSGLILNITSTNAVIPLARMQAYNASKAGLEHLSRGLAVEYESTGIRVNSVVLGGVLDGDAGKATRRALSEYMTGAPPATESSFPSSTVKTSDEVARTLAALCSDDCSTITGASIAIDGGVSAGVLSNRYWVGSATARSSAAGQGSR
jgi:3-oxoacyl-[acyl-carrier protein] reductase